MIPCPNMDSPLQRLAHYAAELQKLKLMAIKPGKQGEDASQLIARVQQSNHTSREDEESLLEIMNEARSDLPACP